MLIILFIFFFSFSRFIIVIFSCGGPRINPLIRKNPLLFFDVCVFCFFLCVGVFLFVFGKKTFSLRPTKGEGAPVPLFRALFPHQWMEWEPKRKTASFVWAVLSHDTLGLLSLRSLLLSALLFALTRLFALLFLPPFAVLCVFPWLSLSWARLLAFPLRSLLFSLFFPFLLSLR